MPFSSEVKTEALTKSGRRCSLCLRYKGLKVEVHHIEPEADTHNNTLGNAVSLCFDCHADAGHYNAKHPRGSKFSPAEIRKHRDRLWKLVAEGKILPDAPLDASYLELLRRAFDRPAFSTPFRQEGRMEDFEKAIDDTVLVLNTGVLRTRDNQVISDIGFGKSSVLDSNWQARLNDLETQLLQLRSSINRALADGHIKSCGSHCYCGDNAAIDELDQIRADIIETLNLLLEEAGIRGIPNMIWLRRG
ncbi:MAG: HNH endonuclease [Actinobacteria bacterium]|nr:HNH endonuclease [Actinomycetota bacterium]